MREWKIRIATLTAFSTSVILFVCYICFNLGRNYERKVMQNQLIIFSPMEVTAEPDIINIPHLEYPKEDLEIKKDEVEL